MSESQISNLKSLLPVAAICSLCLIAIAPLLRADIPCTHDGGLHYYRVVAMRQALNDGILFTRYLPDLAFGYGFPFFNYRAPVSYYLTMTLFLAGLALPTAMKLVYIVSIVGSALTAYLLARDLFGSQAGLVAAIAYAYAPYQFLNALVRGNAPESLALPLLPLILWAFRRLALTGRRRWFLASVGSLATLYLTHNISSLIFTPFLIAYLLVLWLVYRRKGHWIATVGALALALGLTAFFWAPAILEKDYVQLEASRSNRNNDFHHNFLGLAEILAPPRPVDTSLLNPPMLIHLGLVPTGLAAIGLVVGLLRYHDHERRATLVFFALAAIAMVWMSTGASLWVWENLPLISFVQFPWRLVGRAALPIAILAGVATTHTPDQAIEKTVHHASRITHYVLHFTPTILIALIILSAFPSTYPIRGYCQGDPAYPTIEDLFAYEHRPGGLVGADPTGSYFPTWVKQKPQGSPLEEQYASGGPVTRFDGSTLPEGTSIIEADYGPNRAHVVAETPAAFRARYLAFYFPGWRVSVDGRPVVVTPTDPEGLISFDVPAGRHAIDIRFGETPLRLACDIVSTLSLFILIVIIIRYTQISNNKYQMAESRPGFSFAICYLPFVISALLLLAFKLLVVDQADTVFRRPTLQPDSTLPGVQHQLNQRYADGIALIGYDQNRETMPADGILRIDLYLTAYAQPSARYQSVVHLVGPGGLRWSYADTFRPRGYTSSPFTTIWSPSVYALDSHEIEPLPGTPPGSYDVVLTVFDKDALTPLSTLNEQGQPAAPELTLGRVTLSRPRHPAELPKDDRLDLSFEYFDLVTADFNRDQTAPGDSVYLTIMWRANRDDDAASSSYCGQHLALLAPDGSKMARYPLPPPAPAWEKGEVWRSQHQLILPATLGTGTYTWTVERCSLRSYTIGQIAVKAPPHTFTAPLVEQEINTRLDDVATLVGANLESGDPLTITLVWRAEETPTTSYRVFLHLLDAEGNLVAQSDGVPANWTRPTTGWLPGEYITDVHTLAIPPKTTPSEYTLQAGMYIPGDVRLNTDDGSDAIPLVTLTLEGR